MAVDAVTIPTQVARCDFGDGNFFEVYKVTHVTGTDTVIPVSDACISAAVLCDDMTDSTLVVTQTTAESTGISLLNKTTGTSGLSFGSWQTSDGLKQIEIDGNVRSGDLFVVARFSGAAGGGATPNTLDL